MQVEVVPESQSDRLSEILIMTQALVKLQRKGQMVIPRSLREAVGASEGTLMKLSLVKGHQLLVTPQLTVDRGIVSTRPKTRKHALQELARVVAELRQEAKDKGIDTMPMSEIRAAVDAMRRDLKKTAKRPAR